MGKHLAPKPDTAMTLDLRPQQVPSLFLLEHFRQWKDAIGNTNPPMTELLTSAKDLANTSLDRLKDTECLSSPQAKPNGVQPPFQLTEAIKWTMQEISSIHSV